MVGSLLVRVQTKELQSLLNAGGAALTCDGAFGPATRAAFLRHFTCLSARPASTAGVEAIAQSLGATPRQLRAVASVEGGGSGWDRQGMVRCLYERHYLWRRVRVIVPFLSDPTPGGYTEDADHDGICDSWEKLADASARFGWRFAMECASFGKMQVMGAHWKSLGYASPFALADSLVKDELAHYQLFGRFIVKNGLQPALRKISGMREDCLDFARGYNGKGQVGYDLRIARAFSVPN